MSRALSVAAVVLAAGTACSVSLGQSWATATSGSWFTASNWSPASVPTGSAATATLGLTGPYTVTTTNNVIAGLHITNPQARLDLAAGNTLTIDGAIAHTLNGTLAVNPTGSFSGTHLLISRAGTSFAGGGTLRLSASGSDPHATSQTANVRASAVGTLTMEAGTNLAGFGRVNLPTTNNGTFNADSPGFPLRLEGFTHQNNSAYTASNGGYMVLTGVVVNQAALASIGATGASSVQISGSSVSGGRLSSTDTARVIVAGGAVGLDGVTVLGGLDLNGGTTTNVGPQGLTLSNATVYVNTASSFNGTYFTVSSPGTPLNGTGTLRLQASGSDPNTNNLTSAITANGGSLTVASGVAVAGFGILNDVPTTNNGAFRADIDGRMLRVQSNVHANNGSYSAVNGGTLYLNNVTVDNAPAASIVASGVGASSTPSTVVLGSSSVTNGSIGATGGGAVTTASGAAVTLSGVSLSGGMSVAQGSSLYIDSPGITLVNGATVLVNPSSSFSGTHFRTGDAGTLVAGNGTVRLSASGSDPNTNNLTATISEDGGTADGSFVFAPGVTVAGFGIVNSIPTTNNGVFNADVSGRPLRIQASDHQNNGAYRSSNGGTLWLSGTTVTNGPGATVTAGDGSFVALDASRVNGGTLGSPAGGTGVTSASGASTLDGVAVSRQLTLDQGGTLILTSNGVTLTNNAVVTVNTGAAFSGTRIRADGTPTVVSGTGTIRMQASGSDPNATNGTSDLQVNGSIPGSGFTFGAGVTVEGFGRIITAPTTNYGRIDANRSGLPLRIDGATHQNNGQYAASNGGALTLVGATVNQSPTASMTANDGSGVVTSGATVVGGVLAATGSGRFTAAGTTTLSGVTLNAPLDINGSEMVVIPTAMENNGLITVNAQGSFSGTYLRSGAPGAAIVGNGEVRLNKSGSDTSGNSGTADIGATAAGNTFVFGVGQTVSGSGRLTAPVTMSGTLSPGKPGTPHSFIRNTSALSFTDSGRMHVDVASTSVFDQLVNTGSVALNGTLQMAASVDFPSGTTFDIITGGTHTGEFDAVVSTGLAAPKRFGARYDNAGRVRVTVLCGPADIGGVGADGNGDGVLDNNDFIVFVDRFFNNDPRADYGSTGGVPGADGVFDNNDFVVFIDYFFAGCF